MMYTHVAAALVSAALSAWGTWQVQAWRYDAQISAMQEAHAVNLQAAEQGAREREQALNQARQKAEERYVEEKRLAAVAADRARAELDGLRDTLYALDAPAAGQDPAAACRTDAGALERQLLGQCASALVGVAGEADRLAAQVLGLQGYVREVCRAP